MPAQVDKETCTGCGDCVDSCPSGAVSMAAEKAEVKTDDCIDCNACVDACTHAAMSIAD